MQFAPQTLKDSIVCQLLAQRGLEAWVPAFLSLQAERPSVLRGLDENDIVEIIVSVASHSRGAAPDPDDLVMLFSNMRV